MSEASRGPRAHRRARGAYPPEADSPRPERSPSVRRDRRWSRGRSIEFVVMEVKKVCTFFQGYGDAMKV